MSDIEMRQTGDGDFIDLLANIFATEGSQEYLGEAVSMAEHMLQTAANAQNAGAGDQLVAACLLHDIGHFAQIASASTDWHRKHDDAVAVFLEGHFGPEVIEPARLHVDAKRYLCAVEPDYFDKLSPASVHTLEKQGGPMNANEVRDFEANPHYREACRLRRWEEDGKSLQAGCPDFDHFRPILERVRLRN